MKKLVSKPANLYLIATLFGLLCGFYGNKSIHQFALFLSNIFIHLFRCLGAPIIAVSLIVTLNSFNKADLSTVGKKTLTYTIMTTLVAALISMILYLLIKPFSSNIPINHISELTTSNASYLDHFDKIIPMNFFSPFIDNQVIAVLLIGVVIGSAIRFIPDIDSQKTVIQFFKGLQHILFIITKWIIAILPIGIFGFVCVSVTQYIQGFNIQSLGRYFIVILLANIIQGFIILPIWLKINGIKPFDAMKKMMPALSVAFFSKSSSGTLPLTISTAEKNLKLDTNVARLVLPLCTTINMNGCAAFIFATVVYVMQSNGIDISMATMFIWVFIAVIAAVGNAGVPMGCFFLSTSLLTSQNIPIEMLGMILPFYNLIDMIETSLNVWSDSCVANVVDKNLINNREKLLTTSFIPN